MKVGRKEKRKKKEVCEKNIHTQKKGRKKETQNKMTDVA